MKNAVALMVAKTKDDLKAVPLGDSILTRDRQVWTHEATGAGQQRYWIVDGTLEPSRPREEWLPALILPKGLDFGG